MRRNRLKQESCKINVDSSIKQLFNDSERNVFELFDAIKLMCRFNSVFTEKFTKCYRK